jgi:hypothetical protein
MANTCGCTRAGTSYALVNEKEVKDSAYLRAKVAYFQSHPELYVGQEIYSYVNGIRYIVSYVKDYTFEYMNAMGGNMQIPSRMSVEMFHHNFSTTPISDSNILHEPLKRLRKVTHERAMHLSNSFKKKTVV